MFKVLQLRYRSLLRLYKLINHFDCRYDLPLFIEILRKSDSDLLTKYTDGNPLPAGGSFHERGTVGPYIRANKMVVEELCIHQIPWTKNNELGRSKAKLSRHFLYKSYLAILSAWCDLREDDVAILKTQ